MLEEVRAYARELLAGPPLLRPIYIATVRAWAIEHFGAKDDVAMHAERTARHLWATRPQGEAERANG
jgi:hypothetical protein